MVDATGAPLQDPDFRAKALTLRDNEFRAATDVFIERAQLMRQAGITFGGARDTYEILGYDRTITAQMFRDRYERGGIAGRVVDALPKAVWRGNGKIFEDEDPNKLTKFETEWDVLNKRIRLWPTFQRVHILARLSSFAVLLIGAPGKLSDELPKATSGSRNVLYLTAFCGGTGETQRGAAGSVGADVTIQDYEENTANPRFGLPKTYQLKRTNFSSPSLQEPIHWTRVIHIPAPGFLDDAVFGPPALANVWNYLDDLEKVVGGGAEAFWLRANQGLHLNIDKELALPAAKDQLDSLKEQAEAYSHQMKRWLRTRGVDAQVLGSDVADFKSPSDAILTLIAGTSGIPKRILTGSEMGQLASSQDRDNWADQISDDRTSYAEPMILRATVDRFIEYGYLPTPVQYESQWPEVDEMSEIEKLDAAEKAMKLNDHGETVITGAEVRETYLDLEPLDDTQVLQQDQVQQQAKQLEAALRRGGAIQLVLK